MISALIYVGLLCVWADLAHHPLSLGQLAGGFLFIWALDALVRRLFPDG
jgi:hypothetical protein